jgi:hypothetical protein
LPRVLIPLLALALFAAPACKRTRHPNPGATIEVESELSDTVLMSQPAAASQLLSGFHSLEQNAWRWTSKQFSVSLATPKPAAPRSGRLEMQFTIPDIAAADLSGLIITAAVEGKHLGTYQASNPGEQLAVFPVPPEIMQSEAIIADFTLDKTIPRREGETRDLGVIALRFSLTAQ